MRQMRQWPGYFRKQKLNIYRPGIVRKGMHNKSLIFLTATGYLIKRMSENTNT